VMGEVRDVHHRNGEGITALQYAVTQGSFTQCFETSMELPLLQPFPFCRSALYLLVFATSRCLLLILTTFHVHRADTTSGAAARCGRGPQH
jgi:hypothetical protein